MLKAINLTSHHTILMCIFLHFQKCIFIRSYGCFLCSEFFYSGILSIFLLKAIIFHHYKQITNKSQSNRNQTSKKSQTKKYS